MINFHRDYYQSISDDTSDLLQIYYNSMRGEWLEIRIDHVTKNEFIIQRLFWRGSGYMSPHTHTFAEEFTVITGTATYYINSVKRTAKAGENISLKPNEEHINPFNEKKEVLILRSKFLNSDALAFYQQIYEMIQNEDFIFNEHSLPSKKQYGKLNKIFSSHTRFKVSQLIPYSMSQTFSKFVLALFSIL